MNTYPSLCPLSVCPALATLPLDSALVWNEDFDQYKMFLEEEDCECYFKHIEKSFFHYFLHIKWTNRGHLAAITY